MNSHTKGVSSKNNLSVLATVVVGVIVVVGFVGYAFYSDNNGLSSLSRQNSDLAQQVSVLEQRTVQVATVVNTVISLETTTSVITVTRYPTGVGNSTTATSIVYPPVSPLLVNITQSGKYLFWDISGLSLDGQFTVSENTSQGFTDFFIYIASLSGTHAMSFRYGNGAPMPGDVITLTVVDSSTGHQASVSYTLK